MDSVDYKHYAEISLKILITTIWYFTIFVGSYFTFLIIVFIFRMLSIKWGRKIKPDRKKAILITGATSGFGLTMSKHFYKMGFSVIGGYFNDQEVGYAELLELGIKNANGPESSSSSGSRINFQRPHLCLVKMDVRSLDSIKNSAIEIDSLLDKHDLELYALINNAGIARDGPFEWLSPDSFKDVIDTNITGVVMVTRCFIKRIIQSKGRVINVSSAIYSLPGKGVSVYGGSKSAVAYITDSIDEDLKMYGCKCISLYPGNFLTNSNLIYSRIRGLQESVLKLSEEERKLYHQSIESYTKSMYDIMRDKLHASGEDPNHIAEIYKIKIPDFQKARDGIGRKFFVWFMSKIDGDARGKTIEQSGLVESYEKAVVLKNPPSRLYPGNYFWSYFSGPFIDFMPAAFYRGGGKLIYKLLLNS